MALHFLSGQKYSVNHKPLILEAVNLLKKKQIQFRIVAEMLGTNIIFIRVSAPKYINAPRFLCFIDYPNRRLFNQKSRRCFLNYLLRERLTILWTQ